jgi:hypothetical protein
MEVDTMRRAIDEDRVVEFSARKKCLNCRKLNVKINVHIVAIQSSLSWGSPDPDAGQSEEVGVEHCLGEFSLDNAKIQGKYGNHDQSDLQWESE